MGLAVGVGSGQAAPRAAPLAPPSPVCSLTPPRPATPCLRYQRSWYIWAARARLAEYACMPSVSRPEPACLTFPVGPRQVYGVLRVRRLCVCTVNQENFAPAIMKANGKPGSGNYWRSAARRRLRRQALAGVWHSFLCRRPPPHPLTLFNF